MQAFFNEFETDFDARVSVFRGSCSSLECVELDDSLRWESIAGELYSMLVSSTDGSSGNFGLFVDLGNEFCTDVVNPLPIDGIVFGGTAIGIGLIASSIDGIPLCQEEPFEYPFLPSTGLVAWFSVVGTGASLRVDSCLDTSVVRFLVYSGSCDNLSCVDTLTQGFDLSGGYGGVEPVCPIFVSWESVENVVYYIRAETPAINPGMNLVEYMFRVTEKSP
jgi:hypothetical protein